MAPGPGGRQWAKPVDRTDPATGPAGREGQAVTAPEGSGGPTGPAGRTAQALPRQKDPAGLTQLRDAVGSLGFGRAEVGVGGPQRLAEALPDRGLGR